MEFSPECMANFCMILDDLNFSLTAGCGLRTLVPLEELSATCDIVNPHRPIEVQLFPSLSALCPAYLVLA